MNTFSHPMGGIKTKEAAKNCLAQSDIYAASANDTIAT